MLLETTFKNLPKYKIFTNKSNGETLRKTGLRLAFNYKSADYQLIDESLIVEAEYTEKEIKAFIIK